MSFPRYPQYKDSGVEWLGEVPTHWVIRRLKHVCEVFPSNVDKKAYEGEPPVLLCNYTHVYYNDVITAGMDFMPATASPGQIERFTLRAGDTIITKDSETADDIAIAAYVPADLPGVVCGYHLSMVRPIRDVVGAFVKRLFDSAYAKACFAVRANGLTRVGLDQHAVDNVEFPFPPPAEQAAIAAFLDRETAKIDELVAEQLRLIDLLKEKRQAVISHAITKGLNPAVPMKPSGVEWLGEVPTHWEVKPLRRFSCMVQSGPFGSQLHADEYVSHGIPVINPINLVDGTIVPSDDITVTASVAERLAHQKLQIGDVVFSRRGELGRCALVSEAEQGWLCGTGCMILRLYDSTYDPRYLSRYLSLETTRRYFESYSIGAIMDSLSSSTLLGLSMLVPPIEEQVAIIDFVEAEARNLDSLTSESQHAIELLEERRAALISAAVTGQIDVREIAARTAA